MYKFRFVSAAFLAVLAPYAAAQGQAGRPVDYPNGTVRLIAPFEPGGGIDFVARVLGKKFGELYNNTFIVENKTGGNGDIGTEFVARSKPDGHTLLVTTNATIVINPQMSKDVVRIDPQKSFAPVSLLARQPFALVVNPKLPVKTLGELIEYVRAHPNKVSFGSSGSGGGAHLAGEMLKSRLGLEMQHIPYKGLAPAIRDVAAGHIDFAFGAILTVSPAVKSGQLRVIAVSSLERNPAMPDVPAVAEYPGLEGFESDLWYGLLAPADTDPAIVESLRKQVTEAFKDPDVRSKFEPSGTVLVGSTPKEFAEAIKKDLVIYRDVLKKANLLSE